MLKLASITAHTFQHRYGTEPNYFLATAGGFQRVSNFRRDWWAVCPDGNGGRGCSFSCTPDTPLYSEAALADVFSSMAAANLSIELAGGHVARALAARGTSTVTA